MQDETKLPEEQPIDDATAKAMSDQQDGEESALIEEMIDTDPLRFQKASNEVHAEVLQTSMDAEPLQSELSIAPLDITNIEPTNTAIIIPDGLVVEGAPIEGTNAIITNITNAQTQLFGVSEETQKKVDEVLTTIGLNWGVRKEDLVSVTGLQTPNSGVYRNDNNVWLGTTSKKYTPYQNNELAATIIEAAQELNLEVTSGGELYEGKRVYLQLELPQERIGNTDLKRFVTCVNSHNGLGSVGFGSTNRIVNYDLTFFKVFNQLDKFRHHSSVQAKVKFAVQQLFKTLTQDEAMIESFKLMANTQISDELLKSIMLQCFSIDLDAQQSDLSTMQKNKAEKVANLIENQTKMVGESVWGLFTSVLQFTKTSAPKSKSELDYVMGGEGYNKNLKAYNTILLHLGKNASKMVPGNDNLINTETES